jgi:putative copper resistance protein D
MANLLVWLHIVAAITWIGGMIFLSLILVPEFRRAGLAGERMLLLRDVARRFRRCVWLAMGVLVGTGVVLLDERGLLLTDPLSWPRAFQIKLALVACLVGLSLSHDLFLGPRQVKEDSAGHEPGAASLTRSLFRLVPRLSLLLALAVVFAAVVFVRS